MAIQVLEKINIGNFSAVKNKKKLMEKKRQEQEKVFGYTGMEAYELHKQGKLDCPELGVYFEKLEGLEKDIKELEAEKESLGTGNYVCSCGCTLTPQQRFCPNCGKQAVREGILCSCGNVVGKDMQFCPNCGKSVKDLGQEGQKQNYKECICGAKVEEGQFMCMECGRKVE